MNTDPLNQPNRRVLIIDDSPEIHTLFRSILTRPMETGGAEARMRFDVDCVSQGQEGLEMVCLALAENNPYAVVLVDLVMPPGWNGLETIEQLWMADSRLQVALVTGNLTCTWNEIVSRFGFTDKLVFLKKPTENVELLQLTSALMEKWNLERLAANSIRRMKEYADEQTQELKVALNKIDLMLKSISSVLIWIDEDGCIGQWNESAERAFGLPAFQVKGARFRECPIAWDWAQVEMGLREALLTGKTHRIQEIVYSPEEGKNVTFFIAVNPVFDRKRAHVGFLLFCEDISDRKMMQMQLSHAQKLESIGQLAAGIAHEINTPTQYIGDNLRFLADSYGDLQSLHAANRKLREAAKASGACDHALREVEDTAQAIDLEFLMEEIPKSIEQSLTGVSRVAKIVGAMKEFSHPGSDEKSLVDLNRAIESTVTVARNEWKYVADLEMELDPRLPHVPCLPGEFNQVILNMIVNASHAIADAGNGKDGRKGLITIRTQTFLDHVLISIRDTGCGIPEKVRSRIFDPFFTTKDVGRGTGQGLAISHSVIVDKHKGTISFETESGKGTVFQIRLPRAMEEPSLEIEAIEEAKLEPSPA